MKLILIAGFFSLLFWGCGGVIDQNGVQEDPQGIGLDDPFVPSKLEIKELYYFMQITRDISSVFYFTADEGQVIQLTVTGTDRALSASIQGKQCSVVKNDQCYNTSTKDNMEVEVFAPSAYLPGVFLKKDEPKRVHQFKAPFTGLYFLLVMNEDSGTNTSWISLQLDIVDSSNDKASYPAEYCRLFDNDLKSCDHTRRQDCAYYGSGDNQCRVKGTDPCRLSDGNPAGCTQRGNCVYFPSVEQCQPLNDVHFCDQIKNINACINTNQCKLNEKDLKFYPCAAAETDYCRLLDHDEMACGLAKWFDSPQTTCTYADGMCRHKCYENDGKPEECVGECAYYRDGQCHNKCYLRGTDPWTAECRGW